MRKIKFGLCTLFFLISAFTISGCASTHAATSKDTANGVVNVDPYEKFNRKIYAFNVNLDKVIVRPIAKGYDIVTPAYVQRSVNNFFSNVDEIPNIINDVLQANGKNAIVNFWRLALNSTLGICGLFDVATSLKLPENHQDFGLTLAKWGSKSTPYLVLPLFGPSTIRDTVALPFNIALDPINQVKPGSARLALNGLDSVNLRVKYLSGDQLIEQSFDPYVFVRDAYLQKRENSIAKNSNGPQIQDVSQAVDNGDAPAPINGVNSAKANSEK
jgi:phospholipid-binding lipoprotein MlaA